MFKVKTDKNWLTLVWEIDWVVIVLQDKEKYLLQKAYCSMDRWVLNTRCTWTCFLLPVLSVALTWLWMRCSCFSPEERRASRGGEAWEEAKQLAAVVHSLCYVNSVPRKLKCVWPCISGEKWLFRTVLQPERHRQHWGHLCGRMRWNMITGWKASLWECSFSVLHNRKYS